MPILLADKLIHGLQSHVSKHCRHGASGQLRWVARMLRLLTSSRRNIAMAVLVDEYIRSRVERNVEIASDVAGRGLKAVLAELRAG